MIILWGIKLLVWSMIALAIFVGLCFLGLLGLILGIIDAIRGK